jgi:hypothetical protein
MPRELTETQAFLVLNALPNIGPISLNRLLEELGGDPRTVLTTPPRQLERVKGIGPAISGTIANWPEHFDLDRELERMARANTEFITTRDDGYPRLLREIPDPPICLRPARHRHRRQPPHHALRAERGEKTGRGTRAARILRGERFGARHRYRRARGRVVRGRQDRGSAR